jgi:radical SAM protein with 4Fe4S-binding SPASM domain
MPGDRARQPCVLRREPFGGILFDPRDGTHVEMDAPAYDFLRGWLTSRGRPMNDEERSFLALLQAEVPSMSGMPVDCRVVPDLAEGVPAFRNITVLGSPTLVDLQLTLRCNMGCPHCYASSEPAGEDMPFEETLAVLDALAEVGVCQLALGGGEPLLHPRFTEILYHARERGLVPNLTTTGDGMTPGILRALAECCGAVALSLEGLYRDFDRRRRSGFAFFQSTHDLLRTHGISTVFQVTLSVENMPRLASIVDYCLSCPDLYGVIFLAYKSVGRGEGYQTPLSAMRFADLYPMLRDAFLRLSEHTRVGYDCCLTPGIVGIDAELGHGPSDLLEGCSAARTSVGITTGLDVVPCTFLTQHPLGNLRRQTFLDIWRGEPANRFRRNMDAIVDEKEACRLCASRRSCLGGCPAWHLIRCPGDAGGVPLLPPGSPA